MNIPYEKEIDFAYDQLVKNFDRLESDDDFRHEAFEYALHALDRNPKTKQLLLDEINQTFERQKIKMSLMSASLGDVQSMFYAAKAAKLIDEVPMRKTNQADFETHEGHFVWDATAIALQTEFGLARSYNQGTNVSDSKLAAADVIAIAMRDVDDRKITAQTVSSAISKVKKWRGDSSK